MYYGLSWALFMCILYNPTFGCGKNGLYNCHVVVIKIPWLKFKLEHLGVLELK